LTRASRDFLTTPPAGFADVPLLSRRGSMHLVPAGHEAALEALLAEGQGLREISIGEAVSLVPALRAGFAAAVVMEDSAADIDVAALHQGFLSLHRRRGGILALRSRVGRIVRTARVWEVEVNGSAVFRAPVVVNAAGAWGDSVAGMAGAAPIGLVPMRRTACVIDPAPYDVSGWPMLGDVAETWYCRPEARSRLMVSPADETSDVAHDVQPEEFDIAVGINNMQQALDIEVRRVERSWAGLRTFTPDRAMAIGFDRSVDGFFWCVGQGGYGIQTSPAVGALAADLIAGRDPGPIRSVVARVDPARFTSRSR
jgi:D-arginine dehydrogenase